MDTYAVMCCIETLCTYNGDEKSHYTWAHGDAGVYASIVLPVL